MKKIHLGIIIGCIIISFLLSIILYPQLPEKMVTHWGSNGEVNGNTDKIIASFLIPSMMILLAGLLYYIPRIDPLKKNIAKFESQYHEFIVVLIVFLLAIHIYILLWAIRIKISTNTVVPILVAVLFFYVGRLCEKSKRNWFIGIRTPWTLQDDKIWDKTNKLAGKAYKLAAGVMLLSLFVPEFSIHIILAAASIPAFYSVYYSYKLYSEKKKN